MVPVDSEAAGCDPRSLSITALCNVSVHWQVRARDAGKPEGTGTTPYGIAALSRHCTARGIHLEVTGNNEETAVPDAEGLVRLACRVLRHPGGALAATLR